MRSLFFSAAVTVLAMAGTASAAVISFDFTTLNGGVNNTVLGTSETVNGVTASGKVNGSWIDVPLWLRNQTNDHGLGVCSEGAERCSVGGGDVNELSNQANPEVIRLTRPDNTIWTSLWVSSLDANGSGDSEEGWLFWSNNPDNANLGFLFEFGDFGSLVEGDVLSLAAAASFDPTAKYVFFIPNFFQGGGDNNDYLVWKGTVETVPEPAVLGLLGLGLLGLGAARRRAA